MGLSLQAQINIHQLSKSEPKPIWRYWLPLGQCQDYFLSPLAPIQNWVDMLVCQISRFSCGVSKYTVYTCTFTICIPSQGVHGFVYTLLAFSFRTFFSGILLLARRDGYKAGRQAKKIK